MDAIARRERVGLVVNAHSSKAARLPQLLAQTKEALRGFDVAFQIAYGPGPIKRSPFGRLPPEVSFLPNPCAQGEGVIKGFNALASRKQKPAKLIYTNFDHLALILPKLPELVLRIGEKAVVGRWDADARLYMPHSQFVAETAISYAITYAAPAHPQEIAPSWERREEFEGQAKAKGTLINAYLGLAGITLRMWEGVAERLSALFQQSFESLKKAGIDTGIILALLDSGFGIDNALELPKRYEHEHYGRGSEGEKEYARSRCRHFLMETDVALEFAGKTAQGKLAPLKDFVGHMRGIILGSGFHWPGYEIKKCGESEGRSSFMDG